MVSADGLVVAVVVQLLLSRLVVQSLQCQVQTSPVQSNLSRRPVVCSLAMAGNWKNLQSCSTHTHTTSTQRQWLKISWCSRGWLRSLSLPITITAAKVTAAATIGLLCKSQWFYYHISVAVLIVAGLSLHNHNHHAQPNHSMALRPLVCLLALGLSLECKYMSPLPAFPFVFFIVLLSSSRHK